MFQARGPRLSVLKRGIILQQRTIVLTRLNTKSKQYKKSKIKNVKFEDLTPDKVLAIDDSKVLEFKLKQLQEFTRSVREQIKNSSTAAIKDEELNRNSDVTAHIGSDADADASEVVFRSLLPEPPKEGEIKAIDTPELPNSEPQTGANLSEFILSISEERASRLVPKGIREAIGDDKLIISALSNKSNQNWNIIIERLYDTPLKLGRVSKMDLKSFLLPNIKNLAFENILKLEQMLFDEREVPKMGTKVLRAIYDCLFENLAALSPMTTDPSTDPILTKFKKLLDDYNKSQLKMRDRTLNLCLTYAAKFKDISTMDYFLKRFKELYGITPNRQNYTKIIQFYDSLNMIPQAWDVFDTMKFLSTSHAPDIFTYNTMLRVCEHEKNYAKALDLYQELRDKGITPNSDTLLSIAKVLAICSRDNITSEGNENSIRLLGWKFIGNMMANEDYASVSAMMALAAYDGDISLSRALFFRYTMNEYSKLQRTTDNHVQIWSKCIDPSLFNYLLLAYSKYRPDNVPLLFGWDEGSKLRRNLLNSVDYTGRTTELPTSLPFLPIIELNTPDLLIAESDALWKFAVTNGNSGPTAGLDDTRILELCAAPPSSFENFKYDILSEVNAWKKSTINNKILNVKCLMTFLTIPLRLGTKEQFLERLNAFTFKQHELDNILLQLYNKDKQLPDNEKSVGTSETILEVSRRTFDTDEGARYIRSLRHKILFDAPIYELAMKAATAFDDAALAQKIWEDRGKFRNTKAYSKLSVKERISRDTTFAQLMTDFFTKQRRYDEALSIVLSSKRYINWTYPMIKRLLAGLTELDDKNSIKILLDVVDKKESPIRHIEEQLEELTI